ncbi:DNA-processing protein DprA [Candidatus Saccharibacteria bacterium]|nr:DNA-processing protein DprA [Candidatus Saccharibacteria bacterium]
MSTLFSHFSAKINQISPQEAAFTEVLDTIALKPKTLYFYGKMPKNMSKNGKSVRPKTVAIVGSRHNTKYGEEIAYQLTLELAKHDVVVVSGLAYGIDSIAHRGCLDGGGVTLAVLGTPIDQIYPKNHLGLAEQIIQQGGAIISEYPPRTAAYQKAPLAPGEYYAATRTQDPKLSFLYRNRLISGLSDIVVVVEAAEKSGSLNTATHALSQGKEVFAVPGNITNPYSQGCNKLIKQGALPYTTPQDVLELLFPEVTLQRRKLHQAKLIGDTDVETLILQALGQGSRSGEEIMQKTHLPPEVFNEAISLLEIKSRVFSLGLNCWALKA